MISPSGSVGYGSIYCGSGGGEYVLHVVAVSSAGLGRANNVVSLW